MKIFYYHNARLGVIGGAAIHIYEIVNNMLQLGHEVIFLNSKLYKNDVHITDLICIRQSFWARLTSKFPNITIILLFMVAIRDFIKGCFIILFGKYRPDIIYERDSIFNGGYYLAKLFRMPFIKEVNGLTYDGMASLRKYNTLTLKVVDILEKHNMKKADKLIAVTPALKELLVKKYKAQANKIVVIENGVDIELFKPIDIIEAKKKVDLNLKYHYVCYIGHLQVWQGVHNLIKAVPLILKTFPNAAFLIVGEGPLREELIDISRKSGILDKVVFTSHVPYNQVPFYINASDICVAPFIKANNERSGLSPLKIYEYAACAKAIVSSRLSNLEFIEEKETGILVEPENIFELSNAIISLLQRPDLRKKMGEHGRQYVIENSNWKSKSITISDIFLETIKAY